jgi:hypothetical protein
MKTSDLRIGIIIPDRGDRPEFLANCKRMIQNQTISGVFVMIVDYPPINSECDITPRYRKGYEFLSKHNFDVILLMENDDYYSPKYIETMISEWEAHGKPDIFGTNYTIYYHIGICKFKKLTHYRRASAMNTLLKPNLPIQWPVDNDPYTDIHLWKQLKGVTFEPKEIISIGIKHNVGKTGGQYHNTKMDRYEFEDSEMGFLKLSMDPESFTFYKSQHEKIQSSFK